MAKNWQFSTFVFHYEPLNMMCLEVPAQIVKKMGGFTGIRLLCAMDTHKPFQCGMVSLGEGKGYISINKQRVKDFNLQVNQEISVNLQPDESEFGMPMPEELAELLEQDEEGKQRFYALTKGKQRYVLHYVGLVKSPQLRVERSILLITNLKKLPQGKESFRAMLGKE